jgi:formylglycine-generating enzyme
MFKKIFALAGTTTLMAAVASVGEAGCQTFFWEPEAGADGVDAAFESGFAGGRDAGSDGAADANGPDTPIGPSAPNCVGFTATCNGKDCCSSSVVPAGSFNRSNDAAFPATVSAFKLDVYEVVVGRFRAFVNAGKGTQASPPAVGDGAHPKITGSGWVSSYNEGLTGSSGGLRSSIQCNPDYPLWSDAPGANETKPMNCVSWFEAFAFCAWDGGWLPTETEWNYAAAGGSEQREYPWGAGIDTTKAAYDCKADGSDAGACAFGDLLVVGSKSPVGDGRWGHADLAGNAWEWTMDWLASPYRLASCVDCADLQAAPTRTFRGGGFNWNETYQRSSYRGFGDPPNNRAGSVGFRCARNP